MMRFLARLFAGGASRERGAEAAASKQARTKAAAPARKPAADARDAAAADRGSSNGDEHFDPYNTGVFDRGAPWDSVRKRT